MEGGGGGAEGIPGFTGKGFLTGDRTITPSKIISQERHMLKLVVLILVN